MVGMSFVTVLIVGMSFAAALGIGFLVGAFYNNLMTWVPAAGRGARLLCD